MELLVTKEAKIYQRLSLIVVLFEKYDFNGSISVGFERAEIFLADYALQNEAYIWKNEN